VHWTNGQQTIENEFHVAISAEKSTAASQAAAAAPARRAATTTTTTTANLPSTSKGYMAPTDLKGESFCESELQTKPTKPPRHKQKACQQPTNETTIDNLDDADDVVVDRNDRNGDDDDDDDVELKVSLLQSSGVEWSDSKEKLTTTTSTTTSYNRITFLYQLNHLSIFLWLYISLLFAWAFIFHNLVWRIININICPICNNNKLFNVSLACLTMSLSLLCLIWLIKTQSM